MANAPPGIHSIPSLSNSFELTSPRYPRSRRFTGDGGDALTQWLEPTCPPHQYRNEVPQHHHRDMPSSRAVWHSAVLSHQHSWACGKFGTKRPQVQILSPRPFPQVADLRECCFLGAASHLPALATEASREQKGTRGNKKESRGRLRQAEEHPASQHEIANPTAQEGPSGHCDPPSTTKRPLGRDVRRPAITADPKSASSSGSGPTPSALKSTNECVQMTIRLLR